MKVQKAYKVLTDPKMANLECNFKIIKKKKITLEDVISEMHSMENRIMARIDNLVAKNNLKE